MTQSATRSRSLLWRSQRRTRAQAGVARVDARTKRLVPRAQPGDIAVIDHEDLDRVSAEALVGAGVGAVVNSAKVEAGASVFGSRWWASALVCWH